MLEEVENLSLSKDLLTVVFSGLVSIFLHSVNPCNDSDLTIMISDFCHYVS